MASKLQQGSSIPHIQCFSYVRNKERERHVENSTMNLGGMAQKS